MMTIKLKIFSIYQILGGVAGIVVTVYLIASLVSIQPVLFFLLFLATAFCCFSIFSGIKLWLNVNMGIRLSKINQLLQLIQFVAFGNAYEYLSGASFRVGINLTESFNFKFNIDLVSKYQFNFNYDNPDFIVSINLIALFLIIWIDKMLMKIKKQRQNELLGTLINETNKEQVIL